MDLYFSCVCVWEKEIVKCGAMVLNFILKYLQYSFNFLYLSRLYTARLNIKNWVRQNLPSTHQTINKWFLNNEHIYLLKTTPKNSISQSIWSTGTFSPTVISDFIAQLNTWMNVLLTSLGMEIWSLLLY